MRLRTLFPGLVFVAALSSASALTLGAASGRATLGLPVDLSFDVRSDLARDTESTCISARVRMGDVLLPDAKVRLSTVPAGEGRFRLRLQTTVAINEPVLSVSLQTRCSGSVARDYTFLVEAPIAPDLSQSAPSVTPAASAASASSPPLLAQATPGEVAAPAAQRPRPAAAPVRAQRETKAAARQRRTTEQGGPAATAPARRPSPATTRQAEPAPGAQALPERGPRLVMEPLDTWLETPPSLRLSMELATPVPATPGPGDEQSRQLWQALSSDPQALAQQAVQASQTQAQLAQLQTQLKAEQAARAELAARVQALRDERYTPLVVYALLALLLLALAAVGWLLWHRRRSDPAAWHAPEPGLAQDLGTDAGEDEGGSTVWPQVQASDTPVDLPRAAQAPPPTPIPDDLPKPIRPATTGSAAQAPPPLSAVMLGAQEGYVRELEHPEELFDVLQQAEFFISIGEHEDAVEALRRHIAQHRASSPLAYLELLRLYHTLGRVAAFDELRAAFEERFNADIPPFATFQRGGRLLEDYPQHLARIEALWGSAEVFDEIHRLMFREGGAAQAQRFEVPAYEDLLLLLAIADTTGGNGAAKAGRAPARGGLPAPQHHLPAAERPGVETLAGDLMLQPSEQMPVRESEDGDAGTIDTPSPAAPLHFEDGLVQLTLEPRDQGKRADKF
ncbi:hypothetical protein [Comamonas sp. NLF-1-9]|uniref:hypothetical protein n=1 Tax=Comamonas sp. NLF-1-9 TaxID=2853163 RepID=UPI001C47C11F|nr:hypothetical protein [Comamonas sp. NLF-1-9]QXL85522.1 hypothetical protein KUD94_06055 [Comamonas sp. NLF-1-9]